MIKGNSSSVGLFHVFAVNRVSRTMDDIKRAEADDGQPRWYYLFYANDWPFHDSFHILRHIIVIYHVHG
jgi:hypothetical protein